MLAQDLAVKGEGEAAIPLAEEAVENCPCAASHVVLGMAHESAGDMECAMHNYLHATQYLREYWDEVAENQLPTLKFLGKRLTEDYPELAEVLLRRAIAMAPEDEEAWESIKTLHIKSLLRTA